MGSSVCHRAATDLFRRRRARSVAHVIWLDDPGTIGHINGGLRWIAERNARYLNRRRSLRTLRRSGTGLIDDTLVKERR